MHIALVEDDLGFRETVRDYLEMKKFSVFEADGQESLDQLLQQQPQIQVVVLDVNLEQDNGFDICARIREGNPNLGIIMLTARQAVDDQIEGLSSGADIYLTKPIDLRVLAAKLEAMVRRVVSSEPAEEPGWVLDMKSWEVVTPEKKGVVLTGTEMAFLKIMASRTGELVSYDDIWVVFPAAGDVDTHRIAVMVNRVRDKVKKGAGMPLPLKVARNVGYSLTHPLKLLNHLEEESPQS
uniref:Putative two component transcriptional regulator, winged helix family n=1 Tax=Magnetococcus massalia (strain MO-1) TaxID=451514 RepID=A0A1S7LC39_MAGMO|nr:Putative two component transcriptional regulator, winged helix family [Candidatus Magnetococcus massalia]